MRVGIAVMVDYVPYLLKNSPPAGKLQMFSIWWHISSLPLTKIWPSGSDIISYCDVTAKMSTAVSEKHKKASKFSKSYQQQNL